MAMKTVTEMLNEIRNEALQDIQVNQAAENLNKLSALLGNVNEEWVQAEMAFNRYYEQMTNKFEKVSEARAKAKASDEYERKIRAEGMQKMITELLNAHKYFIKIKMQEMRDTV